MFEKPIKRTEAPYFVPTRIFGCAGELWIGSKDGKHNAPSGIKSSFIFPDTKYYVDGSTVYMVNSCSYENGIAKVSSEVVWVSRDISRCRNFGDGYLLDCSREEMLVVSLLKKRPITIMFMPPDYPDLRKSPEVVPDIVCSFSGVLIYSQSREGAQSERTTTFLIEDVVNMRFVGVRNAGPIDSYVTPRKRAYLQYKGGCVTRCEAELTDFSGTIPKIDSEPRT